MQKLSEHKKLLVFVIGIPALIFLIIYAVFLFASEPKIDDWQFKPSEQFTEFSISALPQAIANEFPFSEYWPFYMIGLAILLYFLFPVVIFFQGLYLRIKYHYDQHLKNLGKHRMLMGMPLTIIVLLAIIFIIFSSFIIREFALNPPADWTRITIVVSLLALLIIPELILFVRGLYVWIKYRHEALQRKRGRNKFLFSLYNLIIVLIFLVFALIYSSAPSYTSGDFQDTSIGSSGGLQLWSDSASFDSQPSSLNNLGSRLNEALSPSSYTGADAGNIGLAVGGANDVNNYRENIKNDYLPIPTDLTYEGLYYEYYFDTGMTEDCQKLFCPSYTSAVSEDPFSEKDEFFLSVGLNSGIKKSDFQRKKLNLVIVLDISGSMSYSFNRYYYDQFRNTQEKDNDEDWNKTKMRVASEATVDLLSHLNKDDRFGMVLFDDSSYVAKPLRKVSQTDMGAIENHILELSPQGGTNMSAGIREGTGLFDEYKNADSSEYENRIIFLTDAQPNLGDTSETGLLGMTRNNADDKIYTTFIGIGVDFNTELAEKITKIRGANYYSVHSPSEFIERMDEGFDYMVTPLVFDLELTVDAPGFDIIEVYGSPEANEATGEIMKVNTLFPSKRVDGETKGGLVLLHMKKTGDNNRINLTASYEDRSGNSDQSTKIYDFETKTNYYQNTGIRKGIALARYASLMRNWMIDEREAEQVLEKPVRPEPPRNEDYLWDDTDLDNEESGLATDENDLPNTANRFYEIGIPVVPTDYGLGRWERQSDKLTVSEAYKLLFKEFIPYFESEMNAIGDQTMQQELDILKSLSE